MPGGGVYGKIIKSAKNLDVRKQTSAEQSAKRKARKDAGVNISNYWTGPVISRGSNEPDPKLPSGVGCVGGGTWSRSLPQTGTGGASGNRTRSGAAVSKTEGAAGRCPVKGQEDIDSFGTNAPRTSSSSKPSITQTTKSEKQASGGGSKRPKTKVPPQQGNTAANKERAVSYQRKQNLYIVEH